MSLACKKFPGDQSGSVAILVAVLMPVVIGGIGLGAEAGYWYFNQRKIQNSADVAAYAGAVELRNGMTKPIIDSAAMAAAAETGYDATIGTLATKNPPTAGGFAGDGNAVEVVIQENVPRLLSSLFLSGDVPLSGRAVARVTPTEPTCLLALSKTASAAVDFNGTADAVLSGCNVHANSLANDAVRVSGTARVETPCVTAVGNVAASSGLNMTECTSAVENADTVEDPYADTPKPPVDSSCAPQNDFGGAPGTNHTIGPATYCGGLYMRRNVKLDPGVYVVNGGELKINSTANVQGSGVMFYLTGGATVGFAGGAHIELTAATSGPYEGILLFVDPDDPNSDHKINGDSSSYFDGAFYAPNAHLQWAGNSMSSGGCSQIVASTITVIGTAGLGTNCVGKSIRQIQKEQLVILVE